MDGNLSLHLQNVWQSSKIGFYCLKAAASAEFVEIFFGGLCGWCSVVLMGQSGGNAKGSAKTLANPLTGAEAAGFEPANRFRAVNCFRGSLLQPLGHASCYFIGTLSQTIPIPPSPFSRGRSGPAGFPSPLAFPARQLRPGI